MIFISSSKTMYVNCVLFTLIFLIGFGNLGPTFADQEPKNTVEFFIDRFPEIGENATITFQVTAGDFPRQEFGGKIILPYWIELVEGDLEKFSSWEEGKKIEINATVIVIEHGNFGISAIDDRQKQYFLKTPVFEDTDVSFPSYQYYFSNLNNKISKDLEFHINSGSDDIQILITLNALPNFGNVTSQQSILLSDLAEHERLIEKDKIVNFIENYTGIQTQASNVQIITQASPDLIQELVKFDSIFSITCNLESNCGKKLFFEKPVIPQDIQEEVHLKGRISPSGCQIIGGLNIKNIQENDSRNNLCKYYSDYYVQSTWLECHAKKIALIHINTGNLFVFDNLCDMPFSFEHDWTLFSTRFDSIPDDFILSPESVCKESLLPLLQYRNNQAVCVKPESMNELSERNFGVPVTFQSNFQPMIIPKNPNSLIFFEEEFEEYYLQTQHGVHAIMYKIDNGKVLNMAGYRGPIDIEVESEINAVMTIGLPQKLFDNLYQFFVFSGKYPLEFLESDFFTHKVLTIKIPSEIDSFSINPGFLNHPEKFRVSFEQKIETPFPHEISPILDGFFSCKDYSSVENEKIEYSVYKYLILKPQSKDPSKFFLEVKPENQEIMKQVLEWCHEAQVVGHDKFLSIIVDSPEIFKISGYDLVERIFR